jgi:hypothetical protein
MNQPELLPTEHTAASIVVTGDELERMAAKVRALGGVILSFGVSGATYTINVLLPPGRTVAAINCGCDICNASRG